jgi:TonB family protein
MLSVLFALVLAVSLFAGYQSVFAQDASRKVKRKVQPEYPELAKRLNIRGTVRLQVQITPDGKVKEVKVLGGSPVLVQASVDAAEKWLFEPEPQTSTMVIKFDFNP